MKYLFFLLFSISICAQDTLVNSKQSVIALDKMNVVYRGVENPISIAVNDAKSYTITGNGVKQDDKGNYTLHPGAGLTTKVYVEITKHDNAVLVEEHEFRIKSIAAPLGTFNGKPNEVIASKKDFVNAEIGIIIPDFLYDVKLEVISFMMVYKKKRINVKGNVINKEALDVINKARKNSIIIISDISYPHSPNAMPKKITPILIKLSD